MVAAVQASADPAKSNEFSKLPDAVAARVVDLQAYGDRFEPAIKAILVEWAKPAFVYTDVSYDLSALPSDVVAHITELQAHGDRFEPAIRAILAEAAKPSWSFGGCGHDADNVTLAMN